MGNGCCRAQSQLADRQTPDIQFLNYSDIQDVEYKIFIDDIVDVLRCIGCSPLLRFNIERQCTRNGHGYCKSCESRQMSMCIYRRCSSLMDLFVDQLTKQVITCLPSVCEQEGCQALTFRPAAHEKQCQFFPTTCKLCGAQVTRTSLYAHIENNHKNIRIYGRNNVEIKWRDLHPVNADLSYSYVPVYAYFNFYWMKITETPNENLITVEYLYVANGELDFNYVIKFVLKTPTRTFTEYSNVTMNSYLNDEDMNPQFSIHSETLRSLIEEGLDIEISVDSIRDNND